MSTEADELWRLAQVARSVERKEDSVAHGNFSSPIRDHNRAKQQAIFPRDDLGSLDAVNRVTVFFRQLFGQHHVLTWRGDGDGRTDLSSSDIVIENQLSGSGMPTDFEKPILRIRPGPTSVDDIVIGSLKHFDFSTGSRTYTMLEPGTIQVMVHGGMAADALSLALFIKNAIWVHRRNLCFWGFHDIKNVNVAGYDDQNPSYNRVTAHETHAEIPVNFTYYYQSTIRDSPRSGTYEAARSLIHGLTVDSDPQPGPYLDGRSDDMLLSETTRVLIPLEIEDEK